MHFLCKCGYRIHDNSDLHSYKAAIIADQDMTEFWDLIEKAEQPHTEMIEIFYKLAALMERHIYQCPSCGRIFIENPEERSQLIRFTPCLEGEPEPDVNKRLLISSYGEKWKGLLYADWYDEKPEWMSHHGMIMPNLNIQLNDLHFDDYEAFEKRFYELFEHLKGLHLINHATLNVNRKKVFTWQYDEKCRRGES